MSDKGPRTAVIGTGGNHVAKISQLCQGAAPGTVIELNVEHDDWCALLRGRGACNCNPDVSLRGS